MQTTEKATRYAVRWTGRSATPRYSHCVTIPGYTTTEDFPKMIGIKMGYDPSEIQIQHYTVIPEESDLVPVPQFDGWTNDYSYHRALTCINHQDMRWSTKNYKDRSVFYVSQNLPECDCEPQKYWRVVISETEANRTK